MQANAGEWATAYWYYYAHQRGARIGLIDNTVTRRIEWGKRKGKKKSKKTKISERSVTRCTRGVSTSRFRREKKKAARGLYILFDGRCTRVVSRKRGVRVCVSSRVLYQNKFRVKKKTVNKFRRALVDLCDMVYAWYHVCSHSYAQSVLCNINIFMSYAHLLMMPLLRDP